MLTPKANVFKRLTNQIFGNLSFKRIHVGSDPDNIFGKKEVFYNDTQDNRRNIQNALSFDDIFKEDKKYNMIEESLPFKRDIYKESEQSKERSDEEIEDFKRKYEINSDKSIRPILSFDELIADESIVNQLKSDYEKPTPIQSFAWPASLQGNNIVGLSTTGSGKTISFGVPMVQHLIENRVNRRKNRPLSLIIAPTRELTKQIHNDLSKIANPAGFTGCCFYGGSSYLAQMRDFNFGHDFVVACPGRLLDNLDKALLFINNVSFLVLDEVDRMFDMGFLPQIENIVNRVNNKAQTTIWSATLPEMKLRNAIYNKIKDPLKVEVGSRNLRANSDVTQVIEFVQDSQKLMKLKEALDQHLGQNKKAIVFCNSTNHCDGISEFLNNNGYVSQSIHSKKIQITRERIIKSFRDDITKILVGTDVASRGLDVKNIELVVLYQFPKEIEDYVHRVGRTGRAGKKGLAITFFSKSDIPFAQRLKDILLQSSQEVPKQLDYLCGFAARAQNRFNT